MERKEARSVTPNGKPRSFPNKIAASTQTPGPAFPLFQTRVEEHARWRLGSEVGSHANTKKKGGGDRMVKKSRYGMLECEHDTPTPLHDTLWTLYKDYFEVVPPATEPLLKKVAGPFHKEITIEMGKKRIVGWVIIDLDAGPGTHDEAIDKANELKDALISADPAKSVEARFYELTDSTPP